jgi:hypothetical protein
VNITVGAQLRRREVHDTFGGSRQGGIASSSTTPTVLLFTNPARGHQHGYFDGWGDDGCYYYAGEGQVGDQRMVRMNAAVLHHARDGRKLLLWKSVASGVVAFLGEFTLDKEQPYITTDAPDTNGETRSVIMFRLRPSAGTSAAGSELPNTPPPKDIVTDIPVEQQHTERMEINPSAEPRASERREATLAAAYERHLTTLGHTVRRQKILPAGEQKPLYTDLFDATDNVLIEAKGTATREAIRMALGQLFDYRRFIRSDPSLAILLPTRPRPDLVTLCTTVDVSTIWQDGHGFRSHLA